MWLISVFLTLGASGDEASAGSGLYADNNGDVLQLAKRRRELK